MNMGNKTFWIWVTIGVISGLVVKFVDPIWGIAVWVVNGLGHLLQTTISLPLWLFGLIGLLLVLLPVPLAISLAKGWISVPRLTPDEPNRTRGPRPRHFDGWGDIEQEILRTLAEADGSRRIFGHFVSRIDEPNLKIQAALENLMKAGLVKRATTVTPRDSFVLTRQGRDFLIREGIIA